MDDLRPVVYLNGRFMARSEARLDVEDRGSLFADGVYEVVRYVAGRPFAMQRHVDRLRASLTAIQLPAPEAIAGLNDIAAVSDELVRRNGLANAKVYWQVTRGAAPRDHLFPAGVEPTVLMIAYPAPPVTMEDSVPVRSAILVEDQRWLRCDIKSLMLLPNVLARNQAHAAGAAEAILHRGPVVTEGTATSVFAVRGSELWTHPADQWILPGVTRAVLIELAGQLGLTVREQSYTVTDLRTADEVMLAGTTTHVAAVSRLDGQVIGPATQADRAGPVTLQLHEALIRRVLAECGAG